MASKKARKPNRAEKKLTKSHFKKQVPQHNNNTTTSTTLDQTSTSTIVSTCSSSTTSFSNQDTNYSVPSPSLALLTSPGGVGCCTPKSKKSRIPEMLTCPPAPKKQRVTQNSVLRRRQIVFFAPPEIELFFINAHDR